VASPKSVQLGYTAARVFGVRCPLWVGHLRKWLAAVAMSALPWWSQPVDATLYLEGEMECGLMGHKFHRGFTTAEKTELWDRWKRGESLKAIGRAFGKPSSSIYFLVSPHGGIRPAQRRRSRLALTLAEREVISRGVTANQSARSIARLLGRSPSTVSREMSRNGGCDRYRATLADENAWTRARRPKRCKLANSLQLRRAVAGKLRLDWSPEQIAGWLKRTHPGDECNQVSHETIYRSLFVQTRGVLKRELLGHLRSKRSMRRSQSVDPNGDRRGQIKDIVSIRQRPPAVEDRAVPGHWEGDLLSGPNNSYIATLVERHTRYVMLAKVAGKDTRTVVTALIKQAQKLPKELYKSLTWDRGKELTDHRRFTLATKIDVYFCDPQSPWQRGSNENTNGLLRQYFPKGTDLSGHSQAYLNKVARQLNERPRETLQFETPAERFNACVASTG
jgi:IS30 family transposase